jgi:CRISPR-associated protein Cas2
MVYDINVKRLGKVFKVAKRYLHWVQNSVFEGELTFAQLRELKECINNIIDTNEDSVVFYVLQNNYYLNKEFLGIDKSWLTSNIID